MPDRGIALVTGAGSGIGRAASLKLLEAGFGVAMASLEASPQPDIPQRDGRMRYYQFDLADIEGHARLIEAVERDLGEIACLVNNAGVSSLVRGDLLEIAPASFDRSMAVNLRGTFFLSQAVARRLLAHAERRDRRNRSIITVTSANVEIVGENRGDYCMTKAALAMMTKLFAARLAEAGIAVFELRPGIIATPMTTPAAAQYTRYIEEGGVPMKRWGTPDDVAQAIAVLARGDIPFATGIHIDVGGGLQIHRV